MPKMDKGSDSLPRTVGLRDLLLLSVGGMIGSAVFFFPAFTGQWIGPAAIFAWLVAGVGMISIALCYTELATAFPESGGPAVFPVKTLGPNPLVRQFFSYLEGTSYALGWVFGIAVSAIYVTNYLGAIPFLVGVRSHTVLFGILTDNLDAIESHGMTMLLLLDNETVDTIGEQNIAQGITDVLSFANVTIVGVENWSEYMEMFGEFGVPKPERYSS